ncbi:9210_t:CDS:2, partial [Scutellospora calospora]
IGGESPPPSLNLDLAEEALLFSAEFTANNLPRSNLPTQDTQITYDDIGFSQDPVDRLAEEFESTLYVGPGSLLMSQDDEEQIFPQKQDDFADLSLVEDQLKFLPNSEISESLIDVYFQTAGRHYPHLKKKVVLDCLKELSRPQHFLLLNSIFFAASPFHPNENLNDRETYHQA